MSDDRALFLEALGNIAEQLREGEAMQKRARESLRVIAGPAHDAGLSSAEIARVLGVSRRHVFYVLSGER